MTRVLITGSFKFPNKDAAAFRAYSIGKLFGEDNEVSFAGWERNYLYQKDYVFENFVCHSTGDLEYEKSNLLLNILRSTFRGYRTFRWLIKQKTFDIIITYNPPAFFSILIQIWCLFNKTKLILDTTEWYESIHLSKQYFSFARVENSLRMFFSYKFFKNIICISEFLEHYYKNHSIVIPPLFVNNIYNEESALIKDDAIYFLYAGQMGQKDKLDKFIYLLPDISNKANLKLKLIILGMTFKELQSVLTSQEQLEKSKNFIDCIGRVEKSEVEEYYKKAHFVVFFREEKRYAIAGFPSKSIEAWQHGIPIITNKVGELKKYLEDGKNSIVIENNEKGIIELGEKLKEIVINNRYPEMVNNAHKIFENKFRTDVFKLKFKFFIENLK